jgi:hypothetical protein
MRIEAGRALALSPGCFNFFGKTRKTAYGSRNMKFSSPLSFLLSIKWPITHTHPAEYGSGAQIVN